MFVESITPSSSTKIVYVFSPVDKRGVSVLCPLYFTVKKNPFGVDVLFLYVNTHFSDGFILPFIDVYSVFGFCMLGSAKNPIKLLLEGSKICEIVFLSCNPNSSGFGLLSCIPYVMPFFEKYVALLLFETDLVM